jgi:hypothetical protein
VASSSIELTECVVAPVRTCNQCCDTVHASIEYCPAVKSMIQGSKGSKALLLSGGLDEMRRAS